MDLPDAHNLQRRTPRPLKALHLSRIALQHVEPVIQEDPDAACAAVMVSYFNLSDVYKSMEQFELAGEQFEHAYHFLKSLIDHNPDSDPILQAVLKSSHHLRLEWARYIRGYRKHLTPLQLDTFNQVDHYLNRAGVDSLLIH